MPKINKFYLALILIIIVFLAIKIPTIDFRYGDENIYFEMGNLITQGQLPYQDFFLASPPAQVLLIALVIFIFGFNIFLLKLFPLLFVVGSGFLIYKILVYQQERLAGLIAAIFYLFSFLILTTSDYSSGVHLTVFLCLLSLYLTFKNKFLWAGSMATLALLTRFYAAPVILAILIYVFINCYFLNKPQQPKKYFWQFVLSSGLLFFGINLILYLFSKQNYLQDVLYYHLLKIEEQDKIKVLKFFLAWDWPLVLMSGLTFFIIKWEKIILPLLGIITTGLFLFLFKDIYYLYFNLLLPFIVILAGLLIGKLLAISSVYKKIWRYLIFSSLIISLGALSICHLYFYFQDHAHTARIDYIQDLNNFITNHSTSEDKIYGSFEVVPLVAIMANRQIAGNFIDTNEKTFSTGMFDLKAREKTLKAEKVKFIITKVLVNEYGQLLSLDSFISFDFLNTHCQVAKTYPIKKDYYSNLLIVWECNFTASAD